MSKAAVFSAFKRLGVSCLKPPEDATDGERKLIETVNLAVMRGRMYLSTAVMAERHYRKQARYDNEEMNARLAEIDSRPLPPPAVLPGRSEESLLAYFESAGERVTAFIRACDDRIAVYRDYIKDVQDFCYLHTEISGTGDSNEVPV